MFISCNGSLNVENVYSDLNEKLTIGFDALLQVRDNEQLSRLVQEQETRLEELETQAQRAAEEAHDKLRILEDVQSDKATISRALAQNRELKDQLAELQNGFVKLVKMCFYPCVWEICCDVKSSFIFKFAPLLLL